MKAPVAGEVTLRPRKTVPKAVVQVAWSFAAGGSERYSLDVASAMDRKRYEPHICVLDSGGPLENEARNAGIPVIVLRRRPGIDVRLFWALYRLFRSTRAEVVHTHHFSPLFYSFIGAKLVGARLVHTEHGLSLYTKKRLRLALRILSHFCRAVVAVGTESQKMLHKVVGIPASKLGVIPGGVDLERFSEVSKQDSRLALGLKETDRVAVIVARLSPEKNHRLLLEAFNRVRKQIESARLLIVGEGPEQAAIASAISNLCLDDCVRMLGVRRDIPQILAGCDVFVLCSDREALPIAVLEAMAAGLPVVATDVGDVHTVIRHGVSGCLVPPGDPEKLAAVTVNVLTDPEFANRIGSAGRAVAEKFSVRHMVGLYESLYESDETAASVIKQ